MLSNWPLVQYVSTISNVAPSTSWSICITVIVAYALKRVSDDPSATKVLTTDI